MLLHLLHVTPHVLLVIHFKLLIVYNAQATAILAQLTVPVYVTVDNVPPDTCLMFHLRLASQDM